MKKKSEKNYFAILINAGFDTMAQMRKDVWKIRFIDDDWMNV